MRNHRSMIDKIVIRTKAIETHIYNFKFSTEISFQCTLPTLVTEVFVVKNIFRLSDYSDVDYF